jgi:hypothetical protein
MYPLLAWSNTNPQYAAVPPTQQPYYQTPPGPMPSYQAPPPPQYQQPAWVDPYQAQAAAIIAGSEEGYPDPANVGGWSEQPEEEEGLTGAYDREYSEEEIDQILRFAAGGDDSWSVTQALAPVCSCPPAKAPLPPAMLKAKAPAPLPKATVATPVRATVFPPQQVAPQAPPSSGGERWSAVATASAPLVKGLATSIFEGLASLFDQDKPHLIAERFPHDKRKRRPYASARS